MRLAATRGPGRWPYPVPITVQTWTGCYADQLDMWAAVRRPRAAARDGLRAGPRRPAGAPSTGLGACSASTRCRWPAWRRRPASSSRADWDVARRPARGAAGALPPAGAPARRDWGLDVLLLDLAALTWPQPRPGGVGRAALAAACLASEGMAIHEEGRVPDRQRGHREGRAGRAVAGAPRRRLRAGAARAGAGRGASSSSTSRQGRHAGASTRGSVTPTLDDYAALVLPGGVANPDALRLDEDAVAFVTAVRRVGQAGRCDLPRGVDPGRGRCGQGTPAGRVAERADRHPQRRRRVGRRGRGHRRQPRSRSRNPGDIPCVQQRAARGARRWGRRTS